MESKIILKQAVLHILDSNASMPVYSTSLLDLSGEIDVFIVKHIEKVLLDGNLQKAIFIEDTQTDNWANKYKVGALTFLDLSVSLADSLFSIMVKHVAIPQADLMVCEFEHASENHLGIFKLNYKQGYSHYVAHSKAGVVNSIIRQRTLLPLESQKIEECAVIALADFSIALIQEEYEINGEKQPYWSKLFLRCQSELSNVKKLKILDRVSHQLSKKYFEEDFTKVAQVKKAIAESVEETQTIQIERIADSVFPKDEPLKKEFVDGVKKAGCIDTDIVIPDQLITKKLTNHKIETDNGIEINFPAHYFGDENFIEFVNNPDGTISILIKNLLRIENK